MRFRREGAERHGTRDEAAANLVGWLDLFERNRCLLTELEQIAGAGGRAGAHAVSEPLILTILQRANDRRRPAVILAVAAIANATVIRQDTRRHSLAIGGSMSGQHVFGDGGEANSSDDGGRASETLFNHFGAEAEGFEDLRAGVGLQRRDSHFGENLQQALLRRAAEFFGRRLLVRFVLDRAQGLERQPRMHSLRPIAKERGQVMHVPCIARPGDESHAHALVCLHQALMHRTDRE